MKRDYTEKNKLSRLAFYLGELNVIHPFRYGNRITQEVFVSILASRWECILKFEKVDEIKMKNAYRKAFFGNYKLLEEELKKIAIFK